MLTQDHHLNPNLKMRLKMSLSALSLLGLSLFTPERCEAQSAECGEIISLYQSALTQYRGVVRDYLKNGCQEAESGHKRCGGLETAAREMRSTVEMFAARGQALGCRADAATQKPKDNCSRLQSLVDRSREKVDTLRAQQRLQRCKDRRYAPACQALDRALKQPREIEKAALRKASEQKCVLQ